MEKHPIPESIGDKFELFKTLAPELIDGIQDPEWIEQNREVMEHYVSDTAMSIIFGKFYVYNERRIKNPNLFKIYRETFHHPTDTSSEAAIAISSRLTRQLQEWCKSDDDKIMELRSKFEEYFVIEDNNKNNDEI